MEQDDMKNDNSILNQLSKTKVSKFIGLGIVKNIKKNKSFEIEAKIKKMSANEKFLTRNQFLNSEQKIKDYFANNQAVENQIKTRVLISFSFEDDYRLTYDIFDQKFVLETKEKNNNENTMKVENEEASINISKKEEMLIDDEKVIQNNLKKLSKKQFSTIRIKLRRIYLKEYIEASYSEVIQIQNNVMQSRSNLNFNQLSQQKVLDIIYEFIDCYFNKTSLEQIKKEILQIFFKTQSKALIFYEIETEMVRLYDYFHEIVEKRQTQQIEDKLKGFYLFISNIIQWSNYNRYLHPVILGGYQVFQH